MKRNLTPDMHFHLGEYFEKFVKLRNYEDYDGSIALVNDYEVLKEGEGDSFFEKYGVGNNTFAVDKPFERARAYESLLHLLHKYDSEQYHKIHKGTPYFFIGWTSFQFFNFEKALFYMDAAVSEDMRRIKFLNLPVATTTPALDFILLNSQSNSIGVSINAQLQSCIVETIREFTADSGIDLKLKDFVNLFIKPLLYNDDKKHRSVITALYGFILEVGSNRLLTDLRSSDGGAIDPLLSHLFKGARILESLLEAKGGKGNDLKKKVDSLSRLAVNTNYFKGNRTLKSALNTYKLLKKDGNSFQDYSFATSYIIRNTTGHSLLWSDEFKGEESYLTLYKCLVNSVFWAIFKLWIE